MYYNRPKPQTPHQYGKAQRGPLSVNATGYYSGVSSRSAASHAYRMSTHPPVPTKHKKFLRPLSRRHIRSPSIYKPGTILAPVNNSTQQSMYYQVSLFIADNTGSV